jgi:hypothetical protein
MRKLCPIAGACAVAAALAVSGALAAEKQAAPASVEHVSGGVGADELARLTSQEHRYNLKLVFTLNEGNYLADVNVVLTDARGRRLLEHLAPGPLLLARVPPGRYTVSATYEGKTVTREVRVGERLHTVYLRWPADPRTDLAVSRWVSP